MSRKTLRAAAAGVFSIAAVTLAGCSNPATQDSPTLTSTTESASPASTPQADPTALAAALDLLIYNQANPEGRDRGGSCFARAVDKAGVTQSTKSLIVERGLDEWGALVKAVRVDQGAAQADLLLDAQLREELDGCVVDALDIDLTAPQIPAQEPRPAPASTKPKVTSAEPATVNLTPSQELSPDIEITMIDQVRPGLVVMFSSFVNEEQAVTIESAGTCLTEAVMRAGLTQKSLRFLAGGAPLGTGSIAEHLGSDEDKQLWSSPDFVAAMSYCLRTA